MKFYECSDIYNYTWDQVARGIWQRYPNPKSSHVLSEDTISRQIIDNKLYTKRFLTKTNHMPRWGERFVKVRNVNIIEESVVDLSTKEIHTYTRNINLTKVMSAIEKVTYSINPSDVNTTLVTRQNWMDSHIMGFGFAIQRFGMQRYRKNLNKTNAGFLHVLNELYPNLSFLSSVPPTTSNTVLEDKKQMFRDVANRAKEIAQEKSRPIYIACDS